ncbi:MAG: 50S ribosomal protein L32 [Candidatus Dadabacteria bacterium]|nr:MAG: 50S ribosomal protein L32 [Candidatus Dadabacteria bacterium]
MAVPKKRTSAMKRDQRRSHHALKRPYANVCSNCGHPVLRHRVCQNCGHYRGRVVVEVEEV